MKPIGYLILVDGSIEAAVYGASLEEAQRYWQQYRGDGKSAMLAAILEERVDFEEE